MKRTVPQPYLSADEMRAHGVSACDFVLVSGDAYIDHPSFGACIIARVLLARGFSVGLIAQPDWHGAESFRALGRPKYAFLVTSGNLDSMVNHYTAAKRPRTDDAYSPNGAAGRRPDRACTVYGNRCREAYAGVPIVLGGIEASLRRFAHYDYWDDRVRHSVLYDACADLLVYGMGERAIVEIAEAFRAGKALDGMRDIRGVCYRVSEIPAADADTVLLPSYGEVCTDKRAYAAAFHAEMREQDAVRGKRLVQPHEKGALVCNPPAAPLSTQELDAVYALPYTRRPYPDTQGHIPALDEVSFSVTSARGCFGNCNFCALTFHQGRVVQARSHASILSETALLTRAPDFKGYIHDVGGPTANFRHPACRKQTTAGVCADRQCLGYASCKNVDASHADYVALLQKMRAVPGVRKVFIRSGVRFDYLLLDKDNAFLDELCRYHISGQLKVAPEHVSDRVLRAMNKPPHEIYERFLQRFEAANKRAGMRQFVVPYLISSHPGSTLDDAIELALYLKKINHRPEQVQDFYPTPGTPSTCMHYTGLDPYTMEPVYVPRTPEEKAMQRALMQYFLRRNFPLVRKALRQAGRDDLIGSDRGCLVPDDAPQSARGERARQSAGAGAGAGVRKKPPQNGRRRSYGAHGDGQPKKPRGGRGR